MRGDAIDNILADLVTSLSVPSRQAANVDLSGTGNAAPSNSINKNILIAAGWTVATN